MLVSKKQLLDFGRKNISSFLQIRRMDREDKLWRKRIDESWRPPTMQACNIPLEAAVGPENRLPLFVRDPRLDENVTKWSKIYKPSRLLRQMPHLFEEALYGGVPNGIDQDDQEENFEDEYELESPLSPPSYYYYSH
jgi:hypothetical protein